MALKYAVLFLSFCIMFNICNCFVFPDDEILTGYRSNNYVVDENGWLVKNVKPKRQDSPSNQAEEPSKFIPLAKKYDEFDWRLFKIISKSSNENTITSPFSVKLLLAITREAAWGITRNEIENVLTDLPKELNGLSWFEGVVNSLEKKSTLYELNAATKVFLDKQLTPDKSFMDTTQQFFHTKTQTVNFKNTKQSAKIINDWSSDNTKGIIKELVTEDLLEDAAAVLTNAIYFKGVWERHFEKDSTEKMSFHKDNGEFTPVSMMIKQDSAYFLETSKLGKGAQLLRLPYKGGKFAITFILPNEHNGLDEVIASIKPGLIGELQKQLKNVTVDIFIPKFEFKSKLSLKDSLQALNINHVFTDDAKLPGFGPHQTALDDVIQKAGIKIDEEGTEVAVATAAIFSFRISSGTPRFQADHPFAFFIEEETSGALLFAGKVLDPTAN